MTIKGCVFLAIALLFGCTNGDPVQNTESCVYLNNWHSIPNEYLNKSYFKANKNKELKKKGYDVESFGATMNGHQVERLLCETDLTECPSKKIGFRGKFRVDFWRLSDSSPLQSDNPINFYRHGYLDVDSGKVSYLDKDGFKEILENNSIRNLEASNRIPFVCWKSTASCSAAFTEGEFRIIVRIPHEYIFLLADVMKAVRVEVREWREGANHCL